MEKIIKKKKVTAVIFTIFLFVFSICNFVSEYKNIKAEVDANLSKKVEIAENIGIVETAINENFLGRYGFIEKYGYMQKLLGKEEENNFEVVKDKSGKLHYSFFSESIKDVSEYVKVMTKLKSKVEDKDTKLLYLCPPDKYIEGYTEFSAGLPYSMKNETADYFLEQLTYYDIDNIDFRDFLSESNIEMDELFYNTDHHWKIETAFWATSKFFELLKENYNEEIENEEFYSDLNNYNQIVYKDSFLGSMGRKAGRYFADVDDFALIYPKFATDYTYDIPSLNGDMSLTGRFEEALLATPLLRSTDSPYETDKYMIYLYGNFDYVHIKNNLNENGLKICFIKDSFAIPFAAFTSIRCSDVYMLDPRYFEGDMMEYVNDLECDYVCVMYSPEDIDDAFFCPMISGY